jgi:hypothetical protein
MQEDLRNSNFFVRDRALLMYLEKVSHGVPDLARLRGHIVRALTTMVKFR